MGNTHAKRTSDGPVFPGNEAMRDHSDSDFSMPGGSIYTGGYSPSGGAAAEMDGAAMGLPSGNQQAVAAGWPAHPKLLPTVITWSHGGSNVEVEGSFDNWTTRQTLQQSGKDFTIVKLLPPGVYQYKFVVDGEWKCAPDQELVRDDVNNVNNTVEVHEYTPENLESVSGFDPPPSPPSSYDQALPVAEDYTKEPPPAPPHLQLTLLNVPPARDATATLPRPQHVVLNHIYCQRPSPQVNAVVVGSTHRYRSKYVTTVLYKPRRSGPAVEPLSSNHHHHQQQQHVQEMQRQQQQQARGHQPMQATQQQQAGGHQPMQAPKQQQVHDPQQHDQSHQFQQHGAPADIAHLQSARRDHSQLYHQQQQQQQQQWARGQQQQQDASHQLQQLRQSLDGHLVPGKLYQQQQWARAHQQRERGHQLGPSSAPRF